MDYNVEILEIYNVYRNDILPGNENRGLGSL